MKLHELKPAEGSTSARRRVFKIFLSKARKARIVRQGHFKNVLAKEYAVVNVETLNRFDDNAVVDPAALVEAGILKNVLDGVRILGNGELTKALTVRAQGFTKGAQQKIEAAGGKVEVI